MSRILNDLKCPKCGSKLIADSEKEYFECIGIRHKFQFEIEYKQVASAFLPYLVDYYESEDEK